MRRVFGEKLLAAYINIFEHRNSLSDIRLVLEALANGTPFLRHCLSTDNVKLIPAQSQPDIGSSFSSIFLPFHFGQKYPMDAKDIFKGMPNTEPLAAFMEQCARLEHLTEQFAYLKNESDIENRENIMMELRQFLDAFPSPQTFKQWISTLDHKPI